MYTDEEKKFIEELTALINFSNLDTVASTPDYMLATYLHSCLRNYTLHVRARDRWQGEEA